MTDRWHQPLVLIRGGDLGGDTRQTTGMTRLEAISGKAVGSVKLWIGQTHVAPSTSSGDHHHGDAETAIYVVSGQPRITTGQATTERTGPDVHRDYRHGGDPGRLRVARVVRRPAD